MAVRSTGKTRYAGMGQPGNPRISELQENTRILQDRVTDLLAQTTPTSEEYDDTFVQSKLRDLQRQINETNQRIDELNARAATSKVSPAIVTTKASDPTGTIVDVYALGYDQVATTEDVELTSVMNDEEPDVDAQLAVIFTGIERIGVTGGSSGGGTVPVKVKSGHSPPALPFVDVYANGLGEDATQTNLQLTHVLNLSGTQIIPADTEAFMIQAGEEYTAILNGLL